MMLIVINSVISFKNIKDYRSISYHQLATIRLIKGLRIITCRENLIIRQLLYGNSIADFHSLPHFKQSTLPLNTFVFTCTIAHKCFDKQIRKKYNLNQH